MPTYSLDATEIEADIRGVPTTPEPILSDAERAMSEEDTERMTGCYHELTSGSKFVVTTLQKLVRKYPDVVALKNHLAVAYSSSGQRRKAASVEKNLLKQHPEYLFARVQRALDLVEDVSADGRIFEMLGGSLRLTDLEPRREVFHFTELSTYYIAVALFHLHRDRPVLAQKIHDILVNIVGESRSLMQLKMRMAQCHWNAMRNRIAADEAREIRVQVPEPPADSATLERPEFHHAIVEALYERDFDLPLGTLAAIVALPRTTLIEDLQAVLRDAKNRSMSFYNDRDDCDDAELYFPIHAVHLLGELRADEALPEVLALLCQPRTQLDYWFGDHLTATFWEPLMHLISPRECIVEAVAWMLSPGIESNAKEVVAIAATQIALHHPQRRAEVIEWYRHILSFLHASPTEDNILDTRLVSALVWQCQELGAGELNDEISALWDKGYIAASEVGELEDIRKDLSKKEIADRARRSVLPIRQRYRKLQQSAARSRAAASAKAEASVVLPPEAADAKVGRNDPCPCGSGKKYKKCCL